MKRSFAFEESDITSSEVHSFTNLSINVSGYLSIYINQSGTEMKRSFAFEESDISSSEVHLIYLFIPISIL